MNGTFSEAQLFRAYEVVFEALLSGWIVAFAVVFIGAILLIILCCRELKLATRRRDAELEIGPMTHLKSFSPEVALEGGACSVMTDSVRPGDSSSLATRWIVERRTEGNLLCADFRGMGFSEFENRFREMLFRPPGTSALQLAPVTPKMGG